MISKRYAPSFGFQHFAAMYLAGTVQLNRSVERVAKYRLGYRKAGVFDSDGNMRVSLGDRTVGFYWYYCNQLQIASLPSGIWRSSIVDDLLPRPLSNAYWGFNAPWQRIHTRITHHKCLAEQASPYLHFRASRPLTPTYIKALTSAHSIRTSLSCIVVYFVCLSMVKKNSSLVMIIPSVGSVGYVEGGFFLACRYSRPVSMQTPNSAGN